jgi:ubiquitin carboxyl-terminal hydrolase 10
VSPDDWYGCLDGINTVILDIMALSSRRSQPTRYKLFGGMIRGFLLWYHNLMYHPTVLYHHGLSASGGHYTLDVLHSDRFAGSSHNKSREGWVRLDDELVSDVKPEDVFGVLERDDRCAYLLFYSRVGGK